MLTVNLGAVKPLTMILFHQDGHLSSVYLLLDMPVNIMAIEISRLILCLHDRDEEKKIQN